ncbi:hypothetical protein LCGC14_0863990 [marine sediment metagenome]|uniref:Uncharacterized protein n=1 Tax=marine sediment metagenome TaxID=412755 RepID=A0A0F9P6L3_9ZZZZ
MSIAGALSSHLKANTDVSLAVGSRVYRGVAPQGTPFPYIVIQQISGRHVRHMTAASGLAGPVFQISCVADDPVGADDLSDAVREALDHFEGTIGTPPNTATVQAAFVEGEAYTFDPPRDASDVGIHVVRTTLEVWHTETVPVFAHV